MADFYSEGCGIVGGDGAPGERRPRRRGLGPASPGGPGQGGIPSRWLPQPNLTPIVVLRLPYVESGFTHGSRAIVGAGSARSASSAAVSSAALT
jgi:hypothetical protein